MVKGEGHKRVRSAGETKERAKAGKRGLTRAAEKSRRAACLLMTR